MGVLASWISTFKRKFQWVDAVSIVVLAMRATPHVASGDLGVEH